MSVERIQSKVWSGERLTDDELNELTAAAQREGGPTLRTTVAQALINADHPRQAISLLLAVRRDFPKEAQVHLALGRALISLEKWTEAEEPLKRALELNPADPEPLKALATVALRRAEWSRAKELLQQVLRKDPFDSEAQLLFSEVEAAQPADLAHGPSLEDFTHALSEVLKAQSTPFLLQKDAVLIRLGRGGVARFDLDSLFREARRTGQDLDGAVALIGRDFAERSLGLPPGKLQLLSKVLPVLRDSSFLERATGTVRREGPAGLWFFYAVEDPEVVLYVPEGVLSAMRVDLEQLDTAAWKNLEAHPAEVRAIELEQGALRLSATPTGLWALAHGDGHDGARVLTPSHQAALEKAAGPGPWRVYLGLRELVLLCRESDTASAKKLEGLESAREGIGGAWRLFEGRLSPLPEWDV
ncbi:MAG: tetratricopeptide repeat protein [Myxococcales bacterium]|nr:tetratricopeptide repeat protein [Myxococcales bacterium]